MPVNPAMPTSDAIGKNVPPGAWVTCSRYRPAIYHDPQKGPPPKLYHEYLRVQMEFGPDKARLSTGGGCLKRSPPPNRLRHDAHPRPFSPAPPPPRDSCQKRGTSIAIHVSTVGRCPAHATNPRHGVAEE